MKKKILLIDDSKTQLSSLKLFLTKADFEVITANDGLEGIEAAYNNMPDLIVSDVMMPNINGYQLCRLLKNDRRTKHIPIILLTVLDKNFDKFWGLRAGADAYLRKDSGMSDLIAEISNIAQTIAPLSDEEKAVFINKVNFEEKSVYAQISKILDETLFESTIINEFRNLSEFVLETDLLIKKIFSIVSSILDYNLAGIFFNDMDSKKEKVLYISKNDYVMTDKLLEDIKNDFFFKLSGNNDTFYCKYKVIEEKVSSSQIINDKSSFKSELIVPISYEDSIIGGLCLYGNDLNKDESVEEIFNLIINELKLLMKIKWLYSKTKFLTVTDSLTGLYNRRHFQRILEKELLRARRYSNALSVALFDIDHFKKINDGYGHQVGDKVLIEVSNTISKFLRKTDYVARYGGEEFIAILPETNAQKALIPLERIKNLISALDFTYEGEKINITISIGVAEFSKSIEHDCQFIKYADEALYKAKKNGRNRIEVGEISIN